MSPFTFRHVTCSRLSILLLSMYKVSKLFNIFFSFFVVLKTRYSYYSYFLYASISCYGFLLRKLINHKFKCLMKKYFINCKHGKQTKPILRHQESRKFERYRHIVIGDVATWNFGVFPGKLVKDVLKAPAWVGAGTRVAW